MADAACVTCETSKPESAYYLRTVRGKPYRRKSCKECEKNAAKAWQVKNREKVREVDRRRYAKSPDLFKDRAKARRVNFPERAYEIDKAQRARRRARIHGVRYVPVPSSLLKSKLEYHGGRCAYCKEQITVVHWDHWKPISRGGAHVLANLFPSCPTCNQKKAASWPFMVPFAKETEVAAWLAKS